MTEAQTNAFTGFTNYHYIDLLSDEESNVSAITCWIHMLHVFY